MIKKLSRLSMKRYRLEDKEFMEEISKLETELASLKEVSFRSWIKGKLRQQDPQPV